MSTLKLQTEDGKIFDIDVQIANMMITIKTLIDNLGVNDDEVIPLPIANGDVLEIIIKWADHHKNDPPLPPPEEDDDVETKTTYMDKWDNDLLTFDTYEFIYHLISAANFLNVPELLTKACAKVALNIKCCNSPEEVRDKFNIVNDLTPEQIEQYEKDKKWLAENAPPKKDS